MNRVRLSLTATWQTLLPACHRPIMRIGQFSDSFPPIINGVSAFVAEHHSQLQTQGHEAHVFTFGYTRYQDTLKGVWRTPGLPILDSGFGSISG